MSRRAFTLIELLVVISIIGLLSSVVLASLNSAREKGRLSAGRSFDAQVYHTAADSAVGIWDFDECAPSSIAKDRSGNVNNSTLVGTYSAMWSPDTPSGTGCALNLDGVSNFAWAPINPSITSEVTMSGWFYVRDFSFSPGSIHGSAFGNFSHSPVAAGVNFIPRNGSIGFFTGDGGPYIGLSYSVPAPDVMANKWIHGVLTYDGTNVKIYVDGKFVGSKTVTIVHTGTQMSVGKWASSYGGYFLYGMVDSVRIYAKALTASEVGKLYASEAPKFKVAEVIK